MLQKLRDKSSGWIAKVILVLLAVPFAFFGMEQYMTSQVDTWVARVAMPPTWWQGAPSFWPVSTLWDETEIDGEAFRERFEQVRQQRRAAEGDAFDPRAFESAENKRAVLDRLVDERVLRMVADRADAVRAFLVLSVTMVCAGLIFQSTLTAMPKWFGERMTGLVGTARIEPMADAMLAQPRESGCGSGYAAPSTPSTDMGLRPHQVRAAENSSFSSGKIAPASFPPGSGGISPGRRVRRPQLAGEVAQVRLDGAFRAHLPFSLYRANRRRVVRRKTGEPREATPH